ncbi:MAG TPA: hypothetical protein VFQ76_18815 [Longimicrobiaceae bacterium]|nr:hypothetical protein [Longimicrobiaceae bacterium]
MNPRIQVMLDSRQLEALAAEDAEVEGMWAKAVRTLRSSEVAGLDPDSAFTLVYQAALQASTTVLRAAGYRVRGEGHHHHTFAAVAALGLGELSEAARDLNVVRQKRHGAVYDWETRTGAADLVPLRSAGDRLFSEGYRWLRAERPQLSGSLPSPHLGAA